MVRSLILTAYASVVWLLYILVVVVAYFVVTVLSQMFFDGGWDDRLFIIALLLAVSPGKHIVLLSWSSLLYRKRRLRHATLLYPARLTPNLDMENLQHDMDQSASELQHVFGKPLLRPVVIIASPILLMHLRYDDMSAFALPYTVVINPLSANIFYQWSELARHELTHVATYRFLPHKKMPAVLSEGLACYLMQTANGFPIDGHALAILSEELCEPLFAMDDKAFYRRVDALRNYILAGSFTGYLVSCVGWERYHRFYTSTSAARWTRDIEKVFGKSVACLEQEWRKSLHGREDLPPSLPQLKAYWRMLRLVHHWHWEHAARAAEEYTGTYGYDRLVVEVAITSYFLLRQWEHCERWCHVLINDVSPNGQLSRGLIWLYLGCCHDLQGQREDAVGAYQATSQELAVAAWDRESTHTIARRHLKRAFGDADFQRYVRYKAHRLLAEMVT